MPSQVLSEPRRINRSVTTWVLLAAFFVVLYYDVFRDLFKDWMSDDNYSHGLLVPFLIAYLYWMRKDRFKSIRYAPSLWGVGVYVAGLLLFLVGRFGSEFYTTRISFLVLLAGSAIALVGWNFLRMLLPGMALFALSIPLPYLLYNSIALPLRLFASTVSSSILNAIGIPVFNEGNIIQLPSMTLSVEDACSGLRSLMSFITIGAAVIILSSMTKVRKTVFLVSTVVVAILTNVLRIVGTGVLTNYFGKSLAEGFFHVFSGWVIIVCGLGFLFGIFILLERHPR